MLVLILVLGQELGQVLPGQEMKLVVRGLIVQGVIQIKVISSHIIIPEMPQNDQAEELSKRNEVYIVT